MIVKNLNLTFRYSFSTLTSRRFKESIYSPPLRTTDKTLIRNPKRLTKLSDQNFSPVFAYEISRSINLSHSKEILSKNQFTSKIFPSDISSYAASFSASDPNQESKYFFIFRDGTVVFWNFTQDNCYNLIDMITPSLHNALPKDLVEMEELRYRMQENLGDATRMSGEDILLRNPSCSESEKEMILEMFSLSDALSHSVKLNSIEENFDKLALKMDPWINEMRRGLRLTFPSKEVFKTTGELFTLRHLLNITASMSDTPDVYWERQELEQLFREMRNKLNISSRVKILNSKLDMCFELTDILSSHLNARHSTRLEWMIILLILVEVVFATIHFFKETK